MIHLQDVQVVIFDGRGPLNEPLDRWTGQFPRGLLASAFGMAAVNSTG